MAERLVRLGKGGKDVLKDEAYNRWAWGKENNMPAWYVTRMMIHGFY